VFCFLFFVLCFVFFLCTQKVLWPRKKKNFGMGEFGFFSILEKWFFLGKRKVWKVVWRWEMTEEKKSFYSFEMGVFDGQWKKKIHEVWVVLMAFEIFYESMAKVYLFFVL